MADVAAEIDTAADAEELAAKGRARRNMLIIAAVIVAVAVAGVALVFAFVGQERDRALLEWQARMSIVADSRTADVERWVDEQYGTLSGLAENASLQLYVTTLVAGTEGGDEVEAAYLRNLLEATAQRTGFLPRQPGTAIDANVAPSGLGGLAVLDVDGNSVLAIGALPPQTPDIRRAIAEASGGARSMIPLSIGPDGQPVIGFAVPIFAIQAASESGNIGTLVGLRAVGDDLWQRLRQPGATAASAETYLVRQTGDAIEYLSPLADGTGPLKKRLAADTANLAAAVVAQRPGGFALGRDHAGRDVLVTGRTISGTPWFLVHTVSSNEALAPIVRRQTTMITVFLLVIAGVLIGALALWRHGSSLRAAQSASRYKIATERLSSLSRFMRLVTDGQPTAIAAVDGHGHYTFLNKGAAQDSGAEPDALIGKTMADVIGPHKARILGAINDQVLKTGTQTSTIQTFDDGEQERIVKSDHIPLAADRDHPPGVLMILEDVTELMSERARAERTMRDLVGTLVSLVDRRDPYSAHQSTRVAQVSQAIAREMGLPDDVVQTVDIAGNLMNLGKILVPPEILTKTGRLTDEEMAIVRDSMVHTADLLKSVDFHLPVAATLRQLQERWDGKGYPEGLAGEDILLAARIVAVANAFVSMVSPRAYRDAMDFNKATSILTEDVGTRYDRKPLAALTNYINNRGGDAEWAHFAEPPTTL